MSDDELSLEKVISFSYEEYSQHVQKLYDQLKVTGETQSPEKLEATKMNLQRMKRLDKTAKLSEDLSNSLKGINPQWDWTVIIEGWCGDGGQIIPYINKISEAYAGIYLSLILRDDNPEIMDDYLTNGTKSIPVLICRDRQSGKELGVWGPRPKEVLDWIITFKENNPGYTSTEFKEKLHLFYARDQGQAICRDFKEFIEKCDSHV